MPQETKNIIQLKESTSGPNFYPETHKAAIVGKETYSYLGEVVSPGGGGSGSTGGDKPLSVSPRQSVIVGRAIPQQPRKGKRYYFADGVIKVKGTYHVPGDGTQPWSEIKYYRPSSYKTYNLSTPTAVLKSSSHFLPQNVYKPGHAYNVPVIVTIVEESINSSFDLETMARLSFPKNYTTNTESPFIDIVNNKVIVTEIPQPTKLVQSSDDFEQILIDRYPFINNRVVAAPRSSYITFSGHIIAYTIWEYGYPPNRMRAKQGNSKKRRFWPIRRNTKFAKYTANQLRELWVRNTNSYGKVYVLRVRRTRIGKYPYIAFISNISIGHILDSGKAKMVRYPFFKYYKD